MDSSFHEQGSKTQQQTTRPFLSLRRLASIIQWLTGLIHLTIEEQNDAGIYLDHPGGE
jgi:hypothetical protein